MLQLITFNIKNFFKAKETVIWVLVMPFVFAVFFGFVFKAPKTGNKPFFGYVKIEDNQNIEIKNTLVYFLNLKGFKELEKAKEKEIATIVIPPDFFNSVMTGKKDKIRVIISENVGLKGSFKIKSTIFNYYINLIKTVVFLKERGLDKNMLQTVFEKKPDIYLKKIKGTMKKNYSGFDVSFAGNIVMFLIMNVLIYGGISLNYDIKSGITKRILVSPVSKLSFIISAVLFRTFIGVFQALIILIVGRLFFNVSYLTSSVWLYVVIFLFSISMAALSIVFATVFSDEEKLSRFAIMVTLPLAALGGCWWPLEIMPDFWQKIAKFLPTGNMMDTFMKAFLKNITFFDIGTNVLYFSCLTIIFLYLGVSRLKKTIGEG
jgi:ABC-2 type transport system permease protein